MLSKGSEWRRWEPHIHAPGTVMNDQYKGPTAWDDYLSARRGSKTAADAARMFNVHPATIARLLARARASEDTKRSYPPKEGAALMQPLR